jgi:hypothetical protein
MTLLRERDGLIVAARRLISREFALRFGANQDSLCHKSGKVLHTEFDAAALIIKFSIFPFYLIITCQSSTKDTKAP